jgi:hypothetical protein
MRKVKTAARQGRAGSIPRGAQSGGTFSRAGFLRLHLLVAGPRFREGRSNNSACESEGQRQRYGIGVLHLP